jgi:hypothetical protein
MPVNITINVVVAVGFAIDFAVPASAILPSYHPVSPLVLLSPHYSICPRSLARVRRCFYLNIHTFCCPTSVAFNTIVVDVGIFAIIA